MKLQGSTSNQVLMDDVGGSGQRREVFLIQVQQPSAAVFRYCADNSANVPRD
jgi:hypothetical protein